MIKQRYHFIGIGGIGMSGLARISLQRGHRVSGSDASASALTKELADMGAEVFLGHKASQVPFDAFVVYSSGIKENNEEYAFARREGLRCLHRSELLRDLMVGKKPLLVAGTHGKTTTSSLLAHVVNFSGRSPAYCIGGIVCSLDCQASDGSGDFFVAEADESDGSFLAYRSYGAIITNIDTDHMDYWQTEKRLVQGFLDFQANVERKDLFFWCADDSKLQSLGLFGASYGFSSQAELRVVEVFYEGWKTRFSLFWNGRVYQDIIIPLVGAHNVLNSTAVFGLAISIGIEESVVRQALACFQGAKRRTEKKGEVGGIVIYDDYGHHPTEIATTLKGLKAAAEGRRLVVVFQPHRFTRTQDCFSLFGPALGNADLILLMDIYSAGEEAIQGVDSLHLQQEISALGYSCFYIQGEQIVDDILSFLKCGDFVVTMGAGNVTDLGPKLLKRLSKCE